MEVPMLQERWPDVRLFGIDPVESYLDDYPGESIQGVVAEHGEGLDKFHYKKERTTCFKPDAWGDCPVGYAKRYTLRYLDRRFDFEGPILLWMDCEGAELQAITGADKNFMDKVVWIISEVCCEPGVPGWTRGLSLHLELLKQGYELMLHNGKFDYGEKTFKGNVLYHRVKS